MKAPERRDAELNELRWWSKWARLGWRGDGYILSSEELREPFFNRAGSLACGDVAGTASWAERRFSRSGLGATFLVFDSCREADDLLGAGYTQTDIMTVLHSARPLVGSRKRQKVGVARDPHVWTSAYLRSFYGNEDLSASVYPIVATLQRARGVTLLDSTAGGETVGVMALFRTPGIIGAYCVGIVPEHRRQGVATGLLAKAREIADAEGRALILQTLTSDGALRFYLDRGFLPMYAKRVLEKSSNQDPRIDSELDLGVSIERKAPVGIHPFTSVFGGFERIRAVRSVFGRQTAGVLDRLSVEIVRRRGYMRIDDHRGSIVVSAKYLREGREVDVYLDVIHELVHIRQHRDGKELWDKRYEYVDRPTEIEAYKAAVREARRLGMDEEEVARYLKVEWISDEVFERFLKNVGVKTRA